MDIPKAKENLGPNPKFIFQVFTISFSSNPESFIIFSIFLFSVKRRGPSKTNSQPSLIFVFGEKFFYSWRIPPL